MSTTTVTDLPGVAAFLEKVAASVRDNPKRLSFPPAEYRDRLDRLRREMAADGVDLLLLFDMDAICWLHGLQLRWYKASSPRVWAPLGCTAVHVDHDRFIVFEGLEHRDLISERSVATDVRFTDREEASDRIAFMLGELRAEGWLGGTAALERWSPLPNAFVANMVEEALRSWGCATVDATDLVRRVRRTKSPAELEKIEQAAAVCDAGLRRLQQVLRPGITELEAWGELMLEMASHGGEPAAIHELVSVGDVHRNHAWSSTRVIRAGDVLWADPCGVVDRYHANVARTFVVGDVPDAARSVAAVEREAYGVLTSIATPGTPINEVSQAIERHYREAGIWDLRGNGWVGAYELGLSFPPDWVGEFCWSVGEDAGDLVVGTDTVTNFESVIGLPMIDTVVYRDTGTRTLSTVPLDVLAAHG